MVSDGGGRHHWSPGDLKISARDNAEPGWLKCDGTEYSVYDYVNLHEAIGFKFGGSGTMFKVPNFARSVPVGVGGDATGVLSNTIGSTGGSETHALTRDEVPELRFNVRTSGGSKGGPYPANIKGDPHNIMQPSVVVSYFIKT